MIKQTTYRTLIWIIVILFATNLSMGISFLFHKHQDKTRAEQTEIQKIEMPAQQRTRFFREQLNLTQDQIEPFRNLNRDYNRKARQIADDLQTLRIEMVADLGAKNSNQDELDEISNKIGELHAELKKETIAYYLDMKKLCDEDQQEKLNNIFMSVLKTNGEVSIPQQGGWRNRGIK